MDQEIVLLGPGVPKNNPEFTGSISLGRKANTTVGTNSSAVGYEIIASGKSQTVSGEYNVEDTYNENDADERGEFIEIVGNGTANNARSNARVVDWDGNERLNGDLYVQCQNDSTGGKKISPATLRDIPFTLATSDWTASDDVYVAQLESTYLTATSKDIVTFDDSFRDAALSDIVAEKTVDDGTYCMTFTTASIPTDDISGNLYVMDNEDGRVPVLIENTVVSVANGGTGASTPAGAKHNLNLHDGAKPFTVQLDAVSNVSGSYTHTTTNAYVKASMKPVDIEVSNSEAFKDKITVSATDGYITLSCNEVVGDSNVFVTLMEGGPVDPQGLEVTSEEYDLLSNRIGDLSELETTVDSDAVSAINEVNEKIETVGVKTISAADMSSLNDSLVTYMNTMNNNEVRQLSIMATNGGSILANSSWYGGFIFKNSNNYGTLLMTHHSGQVKLGAISGGGMIWSTVK